MTKTVSQARRDLAARLAVSGIESAGLDARFLVEAVTASAARDDPAHRLDDAALTVLADFEARRVSGEPVWRILGEREFWGLTFRLSPATLEPRPDSETIVEAALAALGARRDEPVSILDLGTGTGCLLIAILSECRSATGLGIDLAQAACDMARANAAANGVGDRAAFRQGAWVAGLEGRFDLVVSNPPYIPAGEIETLSAAVREHDPVLALDGGADGLDAYRALASGLGAVLAREGRIVFEIGAGQRDDVVALMRAAGFACIEERRDLGGHIRALTFAGA